MTDLKDSTAAWRITIFVSLAAGLLYLIAASSRDFWAPDEPDFANAVREMRERGNYLLPYQNGVPYSEKPVFFYWTMAATTALTGGEVHPVFMRLPSVIGSMLLVFGAAFLASRRGSTREVILASAMTAVAPLVFWQGQFLQIDALFSGLLLWLFIAQIAVAIDRENKEPWVWAFHLILPVAILTKGPLALVLTGLVAIFWSVLSRSWRPILDLRPFRGAALSVLLVVPWYVAAIRAGGPIYAYDLVVNQNFKRFLDAFDHIQPWYFYLESIWGDFSPWTLPALAAPFLLYKSGTFKARPELLRAAQIIAVVFVFLSISESKQGKYILVLYPLGAVLLGSALAGAEKWGTAIARLFRAYAWFVAALFLAGAIALRPLAVKHFPAYAYLAPWAIVPFALGAIAIAIVLLMKRREVTPAYLTIAIVLAVSQAAVSSAVFRAIDPAKTGRSLYERMKPSFSNGEPLVYYGHPYHCYPILILKRTTGHVWQEVDLVHWFARNPRGHALVDKSEAQDFQHPFLKRLKVVDQQPVGQDVQLLMRP